MRGQGRGDGRRPCAVRVVPDQPATTGLGRGVLLGRRGGRHKLVGPRHTQAVIVVTGLSLAAGRGFWAAIRLLFPPDGCGLMGASGVLIGMMPLVNDLRRAVFRCQELR